ncbi:MAG TPA: hypothetical protein VMT00_15570 [Thermoanaerobaculia bacterium]|nr:hypothetical protein [Thermoanaerobaculia bacterium]
MTAASGERSDPAMTSDLEARLERCERGVDLLRLLLLRESERRQEEVGERDARIVAQQAELFEKVGERDRIILDQQAELLDKVGERDRIITDLQRELEAKIAERDAIIAGLRGDIEALRGERGQVAERDAVIDGLRREIEAHRGERGRLAESLQRDLETRLRERDAIIEKLKRDLQSGSARPPQADSSSGVSYFDLLGELERTEQQRSELEAGLQKIYSSRYWRWMSIYWRTVDRLRALRGRRP